MHSFKEKYKAQTPPESLLRYHWKLTISERLKDQCSVINQKANNLAPSSTPDIITLKK
jgi:hypothetical protein